MKIGILGATMDTPNLGVSTLAVGAVGCLLHGMPDAEIVFVDYGEARKIRRVSAGPFRVDVPLLNMRFSKRVWQSNHIVRLLGTSLLLRFSKSSKLRDRLLRNNQHMRELDSFDMFTSIAGGDSFSDIYGVMRFVYVVLPQLLALMLGKPLILLPQTYGPFKRRWTRSVARWIVERSERALCRDGSSLSRLTGPGCGDSGHNSFCFGVGFAVDAYAPERMEVDGIAFGPQRDSDLIGLNVSGLLFQRGYSGHNEFGLRADYPELIRYLIHSLMKDQSERILLIPHVYGRGEGSESDSVACERIYEELRLSYPGRLGILRGEYEPNEVRFIIGKCGLFIGSRMHACIAALSQAVPAVSIAYSEKFDGVMKTVGAVNWVADARALTSEEVMQHVRHVMADRANAARDLHRTMAGVRESVWHLFCETPLHSEEALYVL